MKNYDQLVEINCNLNWPYITDYLYRVLIACWWFRIRQKLFVTEINKKSATRHR